MIKRFFPSSTAILPIVPHSLSPIPLGRRPRKPDGEPKLPFWERSDHRVPVLWDLYRPLLRGLRDVLRDGEGVGLPKKSELEARMRKRWSKAKLLMSPAQTKGWLQKEYERLDQVELALSGDQELLSIIRDEAQILQTAKDRKDAKRLVRLAKPTQKPWLSPHPIRPTLFNPPLPRLKPQPPGISGMIHSRIVARENRLAKSRLGDEWIGMMRAEEGFLGGLGVRGEGVRGDWAKEHLRHKASMRRSDALDEARTRMKFDPGLLERCAVSGQRRNRELYAKGVRRKRGEGRAGE